MKKLQIKNSLVGLALAATAGAVASVPAAAVNLADPTQPLFGDVRSSGSTEQALKLESILIADDRKVAVINGQSVTEGQAVSAAKVKKILPGKVIVLHQGKQKSLELMIPVITPVDDSRLADGSRNNPKQGGR